MQVVSFNSLKLNAQAYDKVQNNRGYAPGLAWARYCGRTARNGTLSEALVFHQTRSTPKASYIGRIPSSTPQRRTRIIHVFPPESNNENEFTILSSFHTTRVLRNTLLQYQVQSAELE